MAASTGKVGLLGAGLLVLTVAVTLGVKELLDGNDDEISTRSSVAEPWVSSEELRLRADNEALARKNAELLERLAAVETQARNDDSVAASLPTPETKSPLDADVRISALLADAKRALETKRAEDYFKAFLGLIDAGEAAHPAMLELVLQTGNYNQLAVALEADHVIDLIKAITAKRDALGGFLDTVLTRDVDADKATLFATNLLRYNQVESGLSADEFERTLVGIVERAIGVEGDHVEWNVYSIDPAWEIGRRGSTAALPTLSRILDLEEVTDRNRIAVARAIARIGGDRAIEILEGLRLASPDSRWSHLLQNLLLSQRSKERPGGSYDSEVLEFLEGASAELPSSDRSSLLRDQARDPKRLDELATAFAGGELDRLEQRTVLEFLFKSSKAEHRDIAWKRYQEVLDSEDQDRVVADLANRDPHATARLLDRLRADDVSRSLARGFRRLNTKLVVKHQEELLAAAANVALTLRTRAAASTSIARVDPDAAVEALMNGFWQADESHRHSVVKALRYEISDRAARKALDGIAANDESEKVRQAADGTTSR